MTTIGYATLAIIPSLKGVSDSINKQLAAEPDMGKAAGKRLGENIAAGALGSGKRIGKDLEVGVAEGAKGAEGQIKSRLSERLGADVGTVVGRGIGGAIKGSMTAAAKVGELALKGSLLGAAGAATAAVGGIGLALTKGFDRLKSIDAATTKLKALGHSGAEAATIMDNALTSVKGTAFSLGDAATIAASAVAAGVKPGKELAKYLSDVSDAAAVSGTDLASMGDVMNNVTTLNAAYNDSLQILAQRGLPIYNWLSDELHTTTADVKKLASEGKISAQQFQQAIETHIGGAAKTMGDSFQGSVDNAEAALGRLGAALLKPLFVNAAGGIGSITDGLDSMTKWVNDHQPEIIGFFQDMGVAAVSVAQDILRSFGSILQGAGQFSSSLGTILDALGIDNNLKTVGDTITGIGDKLIATAAGFDGAKDKIRAWGDAAATAAEKAMLIDKIPGYKIVNVATGGDAFEKIPGLKIAMDGLKDKTIHINGVLSTSGTRDAPGTRVSTLDGVPDPTQIGPVASLFGNATGLQVNPIPHRASGGRITGPGGPTSDLIPALLSNGEHVWTADEVNKLGGQGAMYRLRGMVKAGLLKGFDTGGSVSPVNPDLLNIMLGRSGQGDNWARYDTYDPMQHSLMYRNMVGVDPSGLRTPGGGLFNPGMRIDTSNVSFSKPKYPYDKNALLFEDLADITTYQKGEFNNPSYFERKAISNNDPLWSWIQEKGGGFADGGAVGGVSVDALKKFASGISGHRYVLGGGNGASFDTDCSGAQATIANFITGGSGRFATGTEGAALLSRGFRTGDPPPGVTAYWIGWKNGGPGGGHTAGTIIDPAGGNVNVEMGGSSGGGAYGASTGASGFPNRAWIQLAGAVAAANANAPVGGEDPTLPDDFSAGTSSSSSASGGLSLSSSFSGLAGSALGNLGKGVGKTGSGSDLSLFGDAAASAVSGQVSSALGVFGVGDAPPFLQAASKLLSGISIGSAGSTGTGTMPPDDAGNMHGTRAGQQPGPVTNIYAQDAEGALTKWQRLQDQLAARKLDHL